MRCYIDFLDSTNNFQKTRKYFDSYELALQFLKNTFESWSPDLIYYEFN